MVEAYDAASSANGYVVDTFRVDWTLASGESIASKKADLLDDTLLPDRYQPMTPSTAPSASCTPRMSTVDARAWCRPTTGRRAAVGGLRRQDLRRPHRLQRPGPAHPRRAGKRRDDPLRLRRQRPFGSRGCEARATPTPSADTYSHRRHDAAPGHHLQPTTPSETSCRPTTPATTWASAARAA